MAKIDVLARVTVTVPDVGLEYLVDWEDASKAKDKAAKWLLGLDTKTFPDALSVHVELQQKSEDVPFISRATDVGEHDKELAIENAVKFLKSYPDFGRGHRPDKPERPVTPRFGGGGRR